MKLYGLIGYPLSHSFSGKYFAAKFEKENILDVKYELFELRKMDELLPLLAAQPELKGFNVTIPYKQAVIAYLNEIEEGAKAVGAVNTVKLLRNDFGEVQLKGYNTDVFGFRQSLKPFLQSHHEKALILGTGGASKAVAYVLNELGIEYFFVSREGKAGNAMTYSDLNENTLNVFNLIINTTPVGMYPNTEACPPIPYQYINSRHFLYDLVYNPKETLFLKKGKEQGAMTQNGLDMLYLQAEKAWEIWNQD